MSSRGEAHARARDGLPEGGLDLSEVFRCGDQSALIANYVSSEDPPAGAWNRHSPPQSPFGKISFPEILSMARGEVYTRAEEGQAVQHNVTSHEWLPWLYEGRGPGLRVTRAVVKDCWTARLELDPMVPAVAVFECQPKKGVELGFEQGRRGALFRWQGLFDVHFGFGSTARRVAVSSEPGSLIRRFLGFRDVQLDARHWRDEAWSQGRAVWMGVEFTGSLTVRFSVTCADVPPPERITVETAARRQRAHWEDFFKRRVPALKSPDPVVRDAYYFAWQTIWSNRCEGGIRGGLEYPYVSPSRLNYGSQWWWDEAFHMVILRHLTNPGNPLDLLRNFWKHQGRNGAIPGAIRFSLAGRRVRAESVGRATMPMQPPVIGLVLDLLKDQPGWSGDLRPVYRGLLRWADWLTGPARDSNSDGLIEYHHSFDSSADQSPRWDGQLLDPSQVVGPMRPTESVDANVWMSLLWKNLAEMALTLGDVPASRRHLEKSGQLIKRVNDLMWDEEEGFYFDLDAGTHRKIPVKTPYGFMPLLWKELSTDRVHRLVREHLLNPKEFHCAFPLPSVSMDDPSFDPADMWRGPAWINVNWMVVEGLHRHGLDDLATGLARKTVELVGPRYQNGVRTRSPRVWEWFDPRTGGALGNNQFSWSALVVDLIVRFLDTPVQAERQGSGTVGS